MEQFIASGIKMKGNMTIVFSAIAAGIMLAAGCDNSIEEWNGGNGHNGGTSGAEMKKRYCLLHLKINGRHWRIPVHLS